MKCDELKPLVFSLKELSFIDESAVQKDFENPHDHAVYKATEVDAAIDELKTAHHKERHEYIKMIAELKAENEKLKAQFVPLYEELKWVKDENENLKNNLFVVETDIAMAARWRKVSEELPQNGQDVWAYDSRSKSILLLEYEKSDEGEGFIVFPYKHDFLQNITQWMPFEKPKAPEETEK